MRLTNKCSINFADDWIRTADLWYQKQPLYQLSHNHCPSGSKSFSVQKNKFKINREKIENSEKTKVPKTAHKLIEQFIN